MKYAEPVSGLECLGWSSHGDTEAAHGWLDYSAGLFQALRQLEIAEQVSSFPKGAALFSQGSICQGARLLLSGKAKLITVSEPGHSLTLRICGPGEILGLGPALMHASHQATAEAMEPVRAAFIPRRDLLGLLDQPRTALHLVMYLAIGLRIVNHRLRMLTLLSSARAKVAALFLDWIAARPQDLNPHPTIHLTHQEIAGLTHLSRETVTRALHELQRDGFVTLRNGYGSIAVPSPERLISLLQ